LYILDYIIAAQRGNCAARLFASASVICSAGFQALIILTFRSYMIYILVSIKINGRYTMQTAKIFINGRSQAVRLPKDFRFSGNDVFIKKIGKMVVLLPKDDPWSSLVNSLDQFTEDFMNSRNQPNQDSRDQF
jgi:antitoxin VapB